MSNSRFDMEQAVLRIWGLQEDLNLLTEAILEQDLTNDQITNMLIGLSELHSLRSQKLFDVMEAKITDGTLV